MNECMYFYILHINIISWQLTIPLLGEIGRQLVCRLYFVDLLDNRQLNTTYTFFRKWLLTTIVRC